VWPRSGGIRGIRTARSWSGALFDLDVVRCSDGDLQMAELWPQKRLNVVAIVVGNSTGVQAVATKLPLLASYLIALVRLPSPAL
jgi:hypothetical protein